MSNNFYNHGSFPTTGSAATSASMRAELDSIASGFDKMPTLTGNANEIVVVNPSATGLDSIPTLPATSGGTGFASYAVGDLVYANTTTTLAKLADVATGNVLLSGGVGVAPSYGKVGLTTHVSGTLPVANGGTGITSFGTGVATALGINVGTAGAFVVNGGALGTPSSGTLTNATGLPVSTGISGLGTNVATALAVNVGSSGAFVVNGGALGTPSSGTLTNATGLPVSTGISGLGTNVATALAVNVGTAGAFVVNGGALGTPSSGTLTNATGLPVGTGISGLGTNVATALAVNVGTAGAFVVNGGALGTPSSGTVTNLTGTASININGTVGATTPAAGTFTSLSDSGNLTFTGTGNRITGDFTNATIANRVMFQTSTVNGNTLVGAIPNGTATASAVVTFNAADPGNASRLSIQTQATEAQIVSTFSGTGTYLPMTFYTGGSERMRIDTSGNVGIGTSSPVRQLAVGTPNGGVGTAINIGSGTSSLGTLEFGDGATGDDRFRGYVQYSHSDNSLRFGTDAVERMRIDSSGNVGIGTSSPSKKLDVFNSGTTTTDFIVRNGTVSLLSFVDSGAGYTGTSTNHPLLFTTNGTERARITSGGDLLVGRTTTGGTAAVSVERSANTATYIYQMKSGQVECTWGFKASTDSNMYIGSGSSSVGTFGVYLTNTGNSWNAVSDERKKTIVEPITNAAKKVSSLRAVIGYYNHDENQIRRPFLIAQDVKEVLPEAVNIQDPDTGTLGMSYTDTIPLLVAAIKELKVELDATKAEVAALKGA